jgi:type IV secretory pathway VirB10-like protein
MPVDVNCIFENGMTGKLYGILASDFKTYSLIFKPYRVVLSDGRFFAVKNGAVYNADKTSLNVADEVNKQYLKRVVASALQSGVKSSFEAYQQYVENKDTSTYTVGSSGTVVQEKHYPSNYPIIAGILGAVSGAVNSIMDMMKSEFQNIPVLFKINAGKTVYAELYITPENVKELKQER